MKGDGIVSKFLIRDKKEDVFHSSGYAKMQAGSGMGASSAESFAHRLKMERNRKMVRKYGDSRIVNDFGKEAIRTQRAERLKREAQEGKETGGRFGALNKGTSDKTSGAKIKPETQRAMMARKNPGISR